jgi:hypothetical protein
LATLLERLATLDGWRKIAGHGRGRDVLELRVKALCDWVERLESEIVNLEDNLTATQTRCTELLEENRALRAQLVDPTRLELGATTSQGLNGPAGPGFEPAIAARLGVPRRDLSAHHGSRGRG